MVPNSGASVRTSDAAERERLFDALFRRHYRPLCRFAARMIGGAAASEDVVQEVFSLIWERHDVISETVLSRAYLYRAVHNAVLNRLRHQRVERRWVEGQVTGSREITPPATALVEEQELAVAVNRAIARLPERTRLVYTLSRQNHLTYGEIAATLGLSVKTVETQMARAFRQLRLALSPFLAGLFLIIR